MLNPNESYEFITQLALWPPEEGFAAHRHCYSLGAEALTALLLGHVDRPGPHRVAVLAAHIVDDAGRDGLVLPDRTLALRVRVGRREARDVNIDLRPAEQVHLYWRQVRVDARKLG